MHYIYINKITFQCYIYSDQISFQCYIYILTKFNFNVLYILTIFRFNVIYILTKFRFNDIYILTKFCFNALYILTRLCGNRTAQVGLKVLSTHDILFILSVSAFIICSGLCACNVVNVLLYVSFGSKVRPEPLDALPCVVQCCLF